MDKLGASYGQPMSKMKFIDIFAGCGGLSLGLLMAGWEGIFAIEKDANAFKTLESNLLGEQNSLRFNWPEWLPQTPHDIESLLKNYTEKLAGQKGRIDLLVGGPPCQGFSSAGKRDPNDPRNRLFRSYLKFVDLVQPKAVLIENVRGISSDFDDFSRASGKINYAHQLTRALSKKYKVWSKILDTSQFGVPQKRHRYFLIATLKSATPDESADPFITIEKQRNSFLKRKGIYGLPVSSKSALSDLEISTNGTAASIESPGFLEIRYRKPKTSYQRLMNGSCIPTDTRLARHSLEISNRFSQLIDICHRSDRLNTSLSPEVRALFGLKKLATRVLDPDSPSPTITSMPDDLIHYSEPRTLTVRENARLQSFPDWFSFHGKYTTGGERRKKEVPRFTQVANAVPPLAAEAIGEALQGYLKNRLTVSA